MSPARFFEGGKGLEEGHGGLLPPFLAMGAGKVVTDAVMADGPRELFRQFLEKKGHFLAQVVPCIDLVQAVGDEIARVKDPGGTQQDIDDGLPQGDGLGAYVVEAPLPVARAHQTLHNGRYGVTEALLRGDLRLAGISPFRSVHAFHSFLHGTAQAAESAVQ